MTSYRNGVDMPVSETPKQLSLDLWGSGGEPLPSPTKFSESNWFYAVLLEDFVANRVGKLANLCRSQHGLSGPIRPARNRHISLFGLGGGQDFPAEIVEAAKHAGGLVEAAPFDVTVESLLSYNNKSPLPLVLEFADGTVALRSLRHSIAAAWERLGLALGRLPSFTPHVTLLYDRKSIPRTALDEPICWTVRDFVLVQSHVGQSRYTIHGRWPLNA